MTTERRGERAVLVCGIIAGGESLVGEAEGLLADEFGDIGLRSEIHPFDGTDYYCTEMGEGLLRRFVIFQDPADPAALAGVKRRTMELESRFSVRTPAGEVRRRINLDPGYVTPSRFVLATTKDFSHRICLAAGIYAEITLNFGKEGIRRHEWTYPDIKSGRYDAFLLAARAMAMDGCVGQTSRRSTES